jgi:hypothetical protein
MALTEFEKLREKWGVEGMEVEGQIRKYTEG